MALGEATAAGQPIQTDLPGRVRDRAIAHRPTIPAAVGVAVGVLVAVYGSEGVLFGLEFALPMAWIAGVLAFAVLAPGRVERSRTVGYRLLLWSTLPVFALRLVAAFLHHFRLDLLGLSAWFVLLVGLELAAATPARLTRAVERLTVRQLPSGQAYDDLSADLERAGHFWSVVVALVVVVLLAVSSPPILIFGHVDWLSWSSGGLGSDLVVGILGAALAGIWLGRMIGYCTLGRTLAKRKLQVRVAAGHPDGAGGLKPIGDFYLYQSLIVTLPTIFLAVWVLVFSLAGASPLVADQRSFLGQYIVLLPVAILIQVLAFFLPMIPLHRSMAIQKQDALVQIVRSWSDAADQRDRLRARGGRGWDSAGQRIAGLTERYQEIEKTPGWPIDPSMRRRFALRNLSFLIPFAGLVIGHQSLWQQLLKGG